MRKVRPIASDVSKRLARVRQRDTDIECALRKVLYASGLRYRLQVPVLKNPRRVADIAIRNARLAIFVDGCFWHGCPVHGTWPKNNADFWREKIEANWREKIEANRARDKDTDARLREGGWTVIRVWQHEDPNVAGRRIIRQVNALRRKRTRSPA